MNTADIIISEGIIIPFSKKELKSVIDSVLDKVCLKNVEVSVSFVSEDEIHSINKEYRNIDDSTDILSFAADDYDGDFITGGKIKKNIGDIVICPDVVEKNCRLFNVTIQEEIKRLIVHGILHLTGEDHRTNDFSNEPMLIKQEEILKTII